MEISCLRQLETAYADPDPWLVPSPSCLHVLCSTEYIFLLQTYIITKTGKSGILACTDVLLKMFVNFQSYYTNNAVVHMNKKHVNQDCTLRNQTNIWIILAH